MKLTSLSSRFMPMPCLACWWAMVALIVLHYIIVRAMPQLVAHGRGSAALGVLADANGANVLGSSPPAMRATTTSDRPAGEGRRN